MLPWEAVKLEGISLWQRNSTSLLILKRLRLSWTSFHKYFSYQDHLPWVCETCWRLHGISVRSMFGTWKKNGLKRRKHQRQGCWKVFVKTCSRVHARLWNQSCSRFMEKWAPRLSGLGAQRLQLRLSVILVFFRCLLCVCMCCCFQIWWPLQRQSHVKSNELESWHEGNLFLTLDLSSRTQRRLQTLQSLQKSTWCSFIRFWDESLYKQASSRYFFQLSNLDISLENLSSSVHCFGAVGSERECVCWVTLTATMQTTLHISHLQTLTTSYTLRCLSKSRRQANHSLILADGTSGHSTDLSPESLTRMTLGVATQCQLYKSSLLLPGNRCSPIR